MSMIVCACSFGLVFNLARMVPTTRVTPEGVCLQHAIWPNQFWFKFTSIIVSILYFFFPFTFILSLYLSIFFHLKKKASSNMFKEGKSSHTSVMDKAKVNVLKTLILLSSCFFLCWCWNITFYLLFILGVPMSMNTMFYNFTVFMMNVNCCINPFCYAVQYREFQQQAKRIFCHCKLKSQKETDTTEIQTTISTVSLVE